MSDHLEPVILRADNFTPPARTPWGGRRIVSHHKAGIDPARFGVVGEAWEFSLDAAFPSRVASPDWHRDARLADVIAAEPRSWIGRDDGHISLLLKLIDAGDQLSVQVHPSDSYAALEPGTCGKPEAWLVVAHEPGAGIWLGLADDISREDVEAALDAGADLAPCLNFVPVAVGDAFVIAPGTVHAIGAGVTVVEPQLVHPDRSGVTYRFWDWGRRYGPSGVLDVAGTPRALHREHALAVTGWDGLRGQAFVESRRYHPVVIEERAELLHQLVLDLGPVSVERLSGRGYFDIKTKSTLTVIYVLAGGLTFGAARRVERGGTVVVPAIFGTLAATLDADTDLLVLYDGPQGI